MRSFGHWTSLLQCDKALKSHMNSAPASTAVQDNDLTLLGKGCRMIKEPSSCLSRSGSQPTAGEQPLRPACSACGFLTGLWDARCPCKPASKPRQTQRQACYKLVLSPQTFCITSWRGQQRPKGPLPDCFLKKRVWPRRPHRASAQEAPPCPGSTGVPGSGNKEREAMAAIPTFLLSQKKFAAQPDFFFSN